MAFNIYKVMVQPKSADGGITWEIDAVFVDAAQLTLFRNGQPTTVTVWWVRERFVCTPSTPNNELALHQAIVARMAARWTATQAPPPTEPFPNVATNNVITGVAGSVNVVAGGGQLGNLGN